MKRLRIVLLLIAAMVALASPILSQGRGSSSQAWDRRVLGLAAISAGVIKVEAVVGQIYYVRVSLMSFLRWATHFQSY